MGFIELCKNVRSCVIRDKQPPYKNIFFDHLPTLRSTPLKRTYNSISTGGPSRRAAKVQKSLFMNIQIILINLIKGIVDSHGCSGFSL